MALLQKQKTKLQKINKQKHWTLTSKPLTRSFFLLLWKIEEWKSKISLFSFLRDSFYVLIQLIISKKLKVSSYTLYLGFCKKFPLCIKVWFLSGFGRWNSFRVQQKVYRTVLRSIYIWFAPNTRLYIFFLKLVVLG